MFALIAAALFVIGAFAADGSKLFGWPALTWLMLGLAAWALDVVFDVAVPYRRRGTPPG